MHAHRAGSCGAADVDALQDVERNTAAIRALDEQIQGVQGELGAFRRKYANFEPEETITKLKVCL